MGDRSHTLDPDLSFVGQSLSHAKEGKLHALGNA